MREFKTFMRTIRLIVALKVLRLGLALVPYKSAREYLAAHMAHWAKDVLNKMDPKEI